MAPGQIVRVINDGNFKAGDGGRFVRVAMPGIYEIVIRGVVYWIQEKRIELPYGE